MSEQSSIDNLVSGLALTANHTCFAARMQGLFSSQDGGQTWRSATDSLGASGSFAVTCVAAAPGLVLAGVAGGVLRSLDGGQTWELSTLRTPPPLTAALAFSPNYTEDGVVFAATMEDGVFRSNDGGRRWSGWNFGLLDLNIFCLAVSPHFSQDETLYAGVESGIFRSTNGGRAWREISLPDGFDAVNSLALSPDFAREPELFAGTESHGLLHSMDGGESWKALGKGIFGGEAINALLLAPDYPHTPDVLALTGAGMWLSRSKGRSWAALLPEISAQVQITSLLAPQGLSSGSPLWLGLANGVVQRVSIP